MYQLGCDSYDLTDRDPEVYQQACDNYKLQSHRPWY